MKRKNTSCKHILLLIASHDNDMETARRLVTEEKISLNCKCGCTCVCTCVNNDDHRLRNPTEYPLYWAFYNYNVKMVKLYLENGADPNIPIQDPLFFMPFYFTHHNTFELVKLLVKHGANLNMKNRLGEHVLFFACFNVSVPGLVKFLINNGACVDAVNSYGKNALSLCAKSWTSGRISRDDVVVLIEEDSSIEPKIHARLLLIVTGIHIESKKYDVLRLLWDKGVKLATRHSVNLYLRPPRVWSPRNHWVYSSSFKERAKAVLLVWKRAKTLDKNLAYLVIRWMAFGEHKTCFTYDGA